MNGRIQREKASKRKKKCNSEQKEIKQREMTEI